MALWAKRCFSIPIRLLGSLSKDCHKSLSTFDGVTVESVKEEFQHFKGGDVKLEKNQETGKETFINDVTQIWVF